MYVARHLPVAEIEPGQKTIEGTRLDASRALAALGIAGKTLSYSLEHPLSRADAEELESISLAIPPKERAEKTGLDTGEIDKLRRDAVKNMGVASGPAAVRVAIVSGLIPIGSDIGYRVKPAIEDRTHLVIALMSLGLSSSAIAKEASLPKSTVAQELSEAQEELGAGNKAHLIRRAFEAGVLEDPDVQYHQAVILSTFLEAADVDFPIEDASRLARSLILQNKTPAE